VPALDRIDTLAQELAMLQDKGRRRIAVLGSRHVPVVSIHLVELVARSLAQEGHSLITSGAQGVNAAVIRSVLEVDPAKITVLLPQSLDRQPRESRDQLERVLHLVEKPEHDELPLPMASSLCNQEIISRCDQLICFAFHDSETLLASCRTAEDMGKVVSLMFFD
jgi:predicted Rossmann-fold nucleotide-binding protein